MRVTPVRTRIFREGEDLLSFIVRFIPRVPERTIIVVTSKVVALAEGRTVPQTTRKTKVRYIKEESEVAIPTKYVWLTIKDGTVMASAGIDESNADGKLILLPKKSFESAYILRKKLQRIYKVKKLGVLITDSRVIPLRAGVTGVAVGYAGFRGIRNYSGTRDLFGRTFKFSRTNIADSVATTAVLLMGEGREQSPLALIFDPPVEFREKVNQKELLIDPADDMYAPLFSKMRKLRSLSRKQRKRKGEKL